MYIVHPFDLDGPAAFACAQSRCPECQDALVRQHEGLVHVVLRRQSRGDVPYKDLLQAGRIGLWQAVLHFDPHRVTMTIYRPSPASKTSNVVFPTSRLVKLLVTLVRALTKFYATSTMT